MCQPLFFISAIIKAQRGTENTRKTKPLKTEINEIKEIITMKKNAIIYIDDTHAQVTKAFEKQARIFGTPEYREWRAYRQDFPSAQMVTKTIKKNTSKRTYKNLTYANMERFLNMQPNGKALIKEFNDQKETAAIQQNPYRAVLAWFLAKFPKYDEYKDFFADNGEAVEPAAEDADNFKTVSNF